MLISAFKSFIHYDLKKNLLSKYEDKFRNHGDFLYQNYSYFLLYCVFAVFFFTIFLSPVLIKALH